MTQVYALAWFLNLLVPTFFTTLIILIVYPPSRPILFPPAPLALVDSSTGGVQSPKAGVLGSHDSATGAPEKHQGEAVEQEASNFVTGIGSIALSSATGKHDRGGQADDTLSKSVPDPTRLASAGATAKASTGGGMPANGEIDQKTESDETAVAAHHDKTKQPMEEAMWSKMRPVMHVVGDIADGWERFAKYAFQFKLLWIMLTSLQRSFTDASFSERYFSLEACRTPSTGCSGGIVHYTCDGHENELCGCWVWLLWRSSHLAWIGLFESLRSELAGFSSAPEVSRMAEAKDAQS